MCSLFPEYKSLIKRAANLYVSLCCHVTSGCVFDFSLRPPRRPRGGPGGTQRRHRAEHAPEARAGARTVAAGCPCSLLSLPSPCSPFKSTPVMMRGAPPGLLDPGSCGPDPDPWGPDQSGPPSLGGGGTAAPLLPWVGAGAASGVDDGTRRCRSCARPVDAHACHRAKVGLMWSALVTGADGHSPLLRPAALLRWRPDTTSSCA